MTDDYVDVRADGDEEVIVPAPCAVTLFVGALTAAGDLKEVTPRLVVGWNASGSPVVVGNDGGLRLLEPGEVVNDLVWKHED